MILRIMPFFIAASSRRMPEKANYPQLRPPGTGTETGDGGNGRTGFWKKYKKYGQGGRIVGKNHYICMIPKL